MKETPASDAAISGVAPPTIRGEVGRAIPPTAWPSLFGVCSMILGVVELGAAAWATFGWSIALRDLLAWETAHSAAWIYVTGIAVSSVAILTGIAAIVGGLALAGRRRRGASIIRWWALFQLFVGAAAVLLFVWAWAEFDMGTSGGPWELVFLFAWVGIMGLWLTGWPLCALLWMARRRIRHEIETWR